ncbi:hypothetical protein D9M72_646300 [compost metagenome]
MHGPETALTLVDTLDLAGYGVFHSVRADLLRRLGRVSEASEEYREALRLAGNAAERHFLQGRLLGLSGADQPD